MHPRSLIENGTQPARCRAYIHSIALRTDLEHGLYGKHRPLESKSALNIAFASTRTNPDTAKLFPAPGGRESEPPHVVRSEEGHLLAIRPK